MNNLKPSGTAFGTLLFVAFLAVPGQAALSQQQHTLPLVPSADSAQEGFLRIINHADTGGTVTIHAVDDSGERFGPIDLELAAGETVHFTSSELEGGNADKGISRGIGDDGEGDWRLELTADAGMDIKPLAYIRTSQGFVTSMHDVVEAEYVPGTPGVDDGMRHVVSFFNPGSNRNQVSRLRIINLAGVDNLITIAGVDDDGEPAPGGDVTLTLSPYEARTISALQLEAGADFLTGSLGDGKGKWILTVTPEFAKEADRRGSRPVQVMSLLFSRETNNLANLSTVGDGNDSTRGGVDTDWIWGGAGDDIINPGDNDANYDSVYGSAGDDTIDYSDSGPSAFQWLGYFGLETGIHATINGVTNEGEVTKGTLGTDNIVNVRNPLDAAWQEPSGGAFGMGGTHFDDRFDLTLADGQWMDVRGEAGDDTFNIVSGSVQINYRHISNGVDVDLEAGRANDDGFGDVDTIIGDVRQLNGGPGNDALRGSNSGDRIDGGAGDDTINPRASTCDNSDSQDQVFGSLGDDTIVYTDVGTAACGSLYYGVEWRGESTISEGQGIDVTINGITNRGTVRKGDDGTDTLEDIATQLNSTMGAPYGYFALYGSFSDDTFDLTLGPGQYMGVRGLGGNDTFHVSGSIRIDYRDAPAGVNVNLAEGTASEDGYGGVDTFKTAVREVRGTSHSDVIIGSDNDETFIGRGGDDTIDGGGGFDLLRFDRSGVEVVDVDLAAGEARVVWDGMVFSYTISNIERINGSRDGDDALTGSGGDDDLRGRGGDDVIEGAGGNDRLEGGGGADVFVFGAGHGHDRITDFSSGDVILIEGLGVTKAEVLGATSVVDGDDLRIDLTSFGGGTILLWGDGNAPVLDESNLLL